MDVDELKELAVDCLGSLSGGVGIFDDYGAFGVKILSPRLADFIERGVGEDVIEEDLFGEIFGPWELLCLLYTSPSPRDRG